MEYAQLVIVAILIEAIWENIKMVWQNGKVSIDMIGSLIISILVCILTKVDIFPMVDVNISVPLYFPLSISLLSFSILTISKISGSIIAGWLFST